MAERYLFQWKAMDEKGSYMQGAMFCRSKQDVSDRLASEGYLPLSVSSAQRYRARHWTWQHKIAFFRQLSTLLKAGMTLSTSIGLIADGHANMGWKAMLAEIQRGVEAGQPFSAVLTEWDDVFPPLYPALMHVGEITGHIDACCLQLANQQERQRMLQKKVVKALRYPVFILLLAVVVCIGMLVFVLPEFTSVYASFDAPLPGFTLFIVSLSDWLQHYGGYLGAVVVMLCLCWRWQHRHSIAWQCYEQKTLLKLPLIGRLYRGGQLSRIFMTLALTQQAGLTLLQSLEAVEKTVTPRLWKEAIVQLKEHISRGNPFFQALQHHSLFTPLCYQLIKVGEEAGALDSLVSRLGELHEDRTNELADNLAASLEPIMMVVTGVLVGALVIAMYLPIFNLGDALG